MLLPGPEAQQLAIYTGWLLNGTRGGLIAGGLFVLPGLLSLLVLSAVYVAYGSTAFVTAVFAGLAPAVIAIVVQAVLPGRQTVPDPPGARRAGRGGLRRSDPPPDSVPDRVLARRCARLARRSPAAMPPAPRQPDGPTTGRHP